jgi:hypothetical protein
MLGFSADVVLPKLSSNMKNTKPEIRIEYWKHHTAALSFEQARNVVERLMLMQNTDPMFYPLMVSLHAFYARPFKHQQKLRNLNEDLIPSNLISAHKMVINLRDRIFAHSDKESSVKDSETDVDLFQLVLVVTDGVMKPGAQMIFHSENNLQKILTLCYTLYVSCMEKARKALMECVDNVLEEGTYRVTTDFESKIPLLIKSETSNEQSPLHLKETMRREQDQN